MHAFFLVAALQVLPAGPVMAGPLADVREPRVALGVIATDLLATELIARPGQGLVDRNGLDSDIHGVVQLGTNFPLLRVGSAILSLQGGVISRFRLEASDNDAFSSDYLVALPLSYMGRAWQGRVRLMHRSSHLGDELVLNSNIGRLEYDHEEIDGMVARVVGPVRVYGAGTLTLASSYREDQWGIQVGADGGWRLSPGWRLRGGLDWQRHSISHGHSRFSAVAGVERQGPAGRLALEGLFQRGASAVGEFFLDEESFWGIQLVLGRSNEH